MDGSIRNTEIKPLSRVARHAEVRYSQRIHISCWACNIGRMPSHLWASLFHLQNGNKNICLSTDNICFSTDKSLWSSSRNKRGDRHSHGRWGTIWPSLSLSFSFQFNKLTEHLQCARHYNSHFTNINLVSVVDCRMSAMISLTAPLSWETSLPHRLGAWPWHLLWSVGQQQMWHKQRSENCLCFGVCHLLLLFGTLRPPREEIWATWLEPEKSHAIPNDVPKD